MLGAALRDEDHRDAFFAQRAEQAMRGAGHADHAGALDVHHRDVLDGGDALDRQFGVGAAQISEPGFSGAKVLRIQIGMPRPTAGAMVCGWITLAPKYASSMASLYDSESMTLASGTRRGSADSTPSTSVQMWISAASSSEPKIEPEKSLPLRPSVVCTPRASRGDEAGDDQRAAAVGLPELRCESGFRLGPLHCGPQGRPLDLDDAARIQPDRRAAQTSALLEVRSQQSGRPQLAVAGNQAAQLAAARAQQRDRAQHALDVLDVGIQLRVVPGRALAVEQCAGYPNMPIAQGEELVVEGLILRLGQIDQGEQCVCDTPARRDDDRLRRGPVFHDARNALETSRVGNTGPAKLVNHPAWFFSRNLHCSNSILG